MASREEPRPDEPPGNGGVSQGALFGWTLWGVGALFYVYDFLIRVSPSVMVGEMMRDFGVTAASLGALSAWYLYSYAVLQIPAGLVLDRWSARRLLPLAAVVTAAGALLLGLAPDLALARLGRFLNGVGGAPAFLGSLALAARWLPPERFAVLSGLTMALGTLGAMLLQPVLTEVIRLDGWRVAMLLLAALGAAIALLLWQILRMPPERGGSRRPAGLAATMRIAARDRRVWMLAVVDCSLAGPMLAFGALWGVPYLMTAYGLDRAGAAAVNAVLLVAWGFGGPVFGWISDRSSSRKRPLMAALALTCALWLALALAPPPPLLLQMLLYVGLGLATGGMMVGFAFARDVAGEAAVTAGGILNTAMTLTGALLQPLFGWLLDRQWAGATLAGARLYPTDAFGRAALLFVALQVAALLVAARLEEPRR
jgi:predicted MFS family arabinose efflux permease